MNRIQKWFEQIAGVYVAEHHRRALAQEIFAPSQLDLSALRKPACCRRKSRTRGAQR